MIHSEVLNGLGVQIVHHRVKRDSTITLKAVAEDDQPLTNLQHENI